MKIKELETLLGYTPLNRVNEEGEISGGYTSDLLSDVMANAPEKSVLITIQGHRNTVAVATLTGIAAIVLCSRRQAPPDMLEAAGKEGIALYSAGENQFTASCRIGALLEKRS